MIMSALSRNVEWPVGVSYETAPVMRVLLRISLADLDALFREATTDAAQEALAAGLSIKGSDSMGNLVEYPAEPTSASHEKRAKSRSIA
jgi:hypothetical protein